MSGEDLPNAANPWTGLRRFTPARVALGAAGVSLPTQAHLDFQLAHARARDAVHDSLDVDALTQALAPLGCATLALRSAAPDRAAYLRRPDLGRRLDESSRARLVALAATQAPPDLLFVIADGLCARAAQTNAAPVLAATLPALAADGLRVGPLVIALQGRVALGDEIGETLGAGLLVMLIGERPGLSSPDSLGAYLTYAPRRGRSDAERNCLSNIRGAGMSAQEAAGRLIHLIRAARRLRFSGVALKDESGAPPALPA